MLAEVTPLILTFNEAPNLERVLRQLVWAPRIVVIDSFSTDGTLEILRSYPQVEVFQRQFDSHANQWNYGIDQVQTEWVLSLDADYVLTEELISEIDALPIETPTNGFFIRFKYCVFGEPLRGTILPPRQALFRRKKAAYIDDGHTQLLQVQGQPSALNSYILHDDRKPLSRWLWAQDRYMVLEVKKLLATSKDELTLSDRIRKTKLLAPPIIFFYCLLLRGGIFSGWAGWYYAFQRLLAEVLLSIHLIAAERQPKT
jgi:glycosyltransferase involved in cell wall biosynthesis